jgi:hypothetical protein
VDGSEGGVMTNPDWLYTDGDIPTGHDFYPDGLTPKYGSRHLGCDLR